VNDSLSLSAIGPSTSSPPIECGLLPGVFRNHLLAEGKIKERVITIDEFKRAKEFFLINSVRKYIRVHLR